MYNIFFFNLTDSGAATAAKLLQSCPTLCDPIDGSSPGSAIPGILQARVLEWVASFHSPTISKLLRSATFAPHCLVRSLHIFVIYLDSIFLIPSWDLPTF